ncbi:hypothetical protein FB451DRAFT_1196369 [Mycena latifolia]|nr:hypothetical protein FB451DRAFT_1196369 [Mycena latifolia]
MRQKINIQQILGSWEHETPDFHCLLNVFVSRSFSDAAATSKMDQASKTALVQGHVSSQGPSFPNRRAGRVLYILQIKVPHFWFRESRIYKRRTYIVAGSRQPINQGLVGARMLSRHRAARSRCLWGASGRWWWEEEKSDSLAYHHQARRARGKSSPNAEAMPRMFPLPTAPLLRLRSSLRGSLPTPIATCPTSGSYSAHRWRVRTHCTAGITSDEHPMSRRHGVYQLAAALAVPASAASQVPLSARDPRQDAMALSAWSLGTCP